MHLDLWSASRHRMILKCGEQFRRRYIEHDFDPPGIALLRGRASHRSVELNLTHKLETGELLELEHVLDLAADAFRAELSGNWRLGGQFEGVDVKTAKATASREVIDLARLHAEKVAPHLKPTHVEARIEIPPNDALPLPFVAVLDLVDDGRVIRDAKTKAKAPKRSEAHESEQLSGQAIAFQALTGRRPDRLQLDALVRTKGGAVNFVPLPTTRTDDDLDVFIARANEAIESVERGSFKPAPEGVWWCSRKWCGYADTCRYFARGASRPRT